MPSPRSLPCAAEAARRAAKSAGQRPPGRGIEIGGEPAAIDRDAERRAIGKFADQIAPAQLDRIDAEPARGRSTRRSIR